MWCGTLGRVQYHLGKINFHFDTQFFDDRSKLDRLLENSGYIPPLMLAKLFDVNLCIFVNSDNF